MLRLWRTNSSWLQGLWKNADSQVSFQMRELACRCFNASSLITTCSPDEAVVSKKSGLQLAAETSAHHQPGKCCIGMIGRQRRNASVPSSAYLASVRAPFGWPDQLGTLNLFTALRASAESLVSFGGMTKVWGSADRTSTEFQGALEPCLCAKR